MMNQPKTDGTNLGLLCLCSMRCDGLHRRSLFYMAIFDPGPPGYLPFRHKVHDSSVQQPVTAALGLASMARTWIVRRSGREDKL